MFAIRLFEATSGGWVSSAVGVSATARAFASSSLVLALGNLLETRSVPAVVDVFGAAFSFAFAELALSSSPSLKDDSFEGWLMVSAMKWGAAVSLCVSALAKSSSGAY